MLHYHNLPYSLETHVIATRQRMDTGRVYGMSQEYEDVAGAITSWVCHLEYLYVVPVHQLEGINRNDAP